MLLIAAVAAAGCPSSSASVTQIACAPGGVCLSAFEWGSNSTGRKAADADDQPAKPTASRLTWFVRMVHSLLFFEIVLVVAGVICGTALGELDGLLPDLCNMLGARPCEPIAVNKSEGKHRDYRESEIRSALAPLSGQCKLCYYLA